MGLTKCACIDTLYTELTWKERFAAAKSDGFGAVEFWDWRDKDLEETRRAAQEAGIAISGFNGDADFSLIDPHHRKSYLSFLEKSLKVAKAIDAKSVTIHSNALGEEGVVVNHYQDIPETVKICSMYDTLCESVKLAEAEGINLNLEALNVTTDHCGNYLKTTSMGAEICQLINSKRLRLLYDVYHMQLNEGCISDTIVKYCEWFGHIHIADAPGRHEPGTGEINYQNVVKCLENCGYEGYLGFELFPKKNTATAVEAIMEIK